MYVVTVKAYKRTTPSLVFSISRSSDHQIHCFYSFEKKTKKRSVGDLGIPLGNNTSAPLSDFVLTLGSKQETDL